MFNKLDLEEFLKFVQIVPEGRITDFHAWRDQAGNVAMEVELDCPGSTDAVAGLIRYSAWEPSFEQALKKIKIKVQAEITILKLANPADVESFDEEDYKEFLDEMTDEERKAYVKKAKAIKQKAIATITKIEKEAAAEKKRVRQQHEEYRAMLTAKLKKASAVQKKQLDAANNPKTSILYPAYQSPFFAGSSTAGGSTVSQNVRFSYQDYLNILEGKWGPLLKAAPTEIEESPAKESKE